MDQRIIANFKRHYKSRVLSHVIYIIDKGCESRAATIVKNLNVLQSLHMQKQAWNTVTAASTIANCYQKAGFDKLLYVNGKYSIGRSYRFLIYWNNRF